MPESFMGMQGDFVRLVMHAVDQQLLDLLDLPSGRTWEDSAQGLIVQEARRVMINGGKRIRAALVMASCQCVGVERESAVLAACAIEALHGFSLIHDDLPCMDNATVRRGLPASHVQIGEAQALLVGDWLQAMSFAWIAQAATRHSHTKNNIPNNSVGAVVKAWAQGACAMIEGQVMEMCPLPQGAHQPTLPQALRLHERKTGEMMRLALRVGPLLAGLQDADPVHGHLADLGVSLGRLYQMADDQSDRHEDAQAARINLHNINNDASTNDPSSWRKHVEYERDACLIHIDALGLLDFASAHQSGMAWVRGLIYDLSNQCFQD